MQIPMLYKIKEKTNTENSSKVNKLYSSDKFKSNLMSKNPHRLQKSNFQNYLTLNNGCKVHFTGDTRPLPHLNPQNILTDNIRQVWLSNEIPATCIIDMRNLEDRPVFFNRIGFLCWHQYQSNPKVIQVQYCRKEDIQNPNNWTIWSKFKLQLLGQWQHFKLPSTMSKNILFLKITILQNHSQKNNQQEDDEQVQKTFDNSTYLNQVSLGFIEQIAESRVQALHTQGNMRQKTFSDFRKSNPSQKQIKKLNDKVKHLSVENEVMKKTIEHQGDIIIKLQEAVEKLTETVSKLQRIQSTQQQKLTLISTKANNRSSHKHQNHKPLLQQYLNSQSQIHNSIESKNNSRQRSNRQNSIYDESNPNSIYQSKKSKSLRNPNSTANKPSTNSKKRNVINANQIQDSQNDLSQYEGDTIDQRAYNIDRKVRQDNRRSQDDTTTKEKTYIPMLQKLQELIILRDKKKHKLRQQTKPYKRNDHIRQGSSSDPQQQEY